MVVLKVEEDDDFGAVGGEDYYYWVSPDGCGFPPSFY
jgi:hypothetical protein